MSPALLTKYLDAAKDVAAHAVLLPHGIEFSAKTTPRDWTEYGLRPFLSGGFGTLGFSRTDVNNVFPDKRSMPAFNFGGGAIGFLSKRTGVRFDLRYYSNLGEPDAPPASCLGPCHLRYMTFTAGVVIRR